MSAAKFWPRESRNLIGPLTIELSTEVNCLRDLLTIFNPTAMAKEQVLLQEMVKTQNCDIERGNTAQK